LVLVILGIVVTDFRDGKIAVLYADEFDHSTSEKMVDLIWDLLADTYSPNILFMEEKTLSTTHLCP
jgi:hypothetical protein